MKIASLFNTQRYGHKMLFFMLHAKLHKLWITQNHPIIVINLLVDIHSFLYRESRIPRIWKTAQDSNHYNPCSTKIKQWKTSEYLNLRQYDFQPDEIRVKHCVGTSSNDVVKQGCRRVMDCVTQYERRKFISKPKGTDCTQWHVFEKDIPVGCECMLAT